jgi:hypothetical protein
MHDLPLVSIVTPSWNQGPFLEETIRSVLDQDYPRIEYIVIDGGSTDSSAEILHAYADRLAFWISEPDGGQADAVNKGWSRSTGDILAFLNSDDCYFPGAIRRIVDAFRAHPEAGVVYGQAQWVTADGHPIRATNIHKHGQDALDRMCQGGIPQPAAFVRRTVVERVGPLDPSFHFALDGEFFLRAIGNYPSFSIPDVIATMRLHGASKSVATSAGFIPELLRIAEKVTAHPELYPRYVVRPQDVRASAHLGIARYQNAGGKHVLALGQLWQSARLSRKYHRRILFYDLPRVAAHTLLRDKLYRELGAHAASLRGRLAG